MHDEGEQVMAYDEGLAQRVRDILAADDSVEIVEIVEKKMFGGLSFMVNGNMCCGVAGDNLMVRVGPEQYEQALALPGARAMDFTKRPMKGFVFVGVAGYTAAEDLKVWVQRGLNFVHRLPPK